MNLAADMAFATDMVFTNDMALPNEDKFIPATRPWSSGNGRIRYERSHDDQKEIDICLECPLSECMDCYRHKKFRFSYLAVEKRGRRT
jgi:hypothetical protein